MPQRGLHKTCSAKQFHRSDNLCRKPCLRPMSWKLTCDRRPRCSVRRSNVFQCMAFDLPPTGLTTQTSQTEANGECVGHDADILASGSAPGNTAALSQKTSMSESQQRQTVTPRACASGPSCSAPSAVSLDRRFAHSGIGECASYCVTNGLRSRRERPRDCPGQPTACAQARLVNRSPGMREAATRFACRYRAPPALPRCVAPAAAVAAADPAPAGST